MVKSNQPTVQQYDAIVVGAGVIGATLALGLAEQKGWHVALIEKTTIAKEPLQDNIRATALGLPSQQLLVELGVWQQLEHTQQCAYGKMLVWMKTVIANFLLMQLIIMRIVWVGLLITMP